jgi:hypothetical protein
MRTHILAALSLIFCTSCYPDRHEALLVPEVFGTVELNGRPAAHVSVALGPASTTSCDMSRSPIMTDAYGSFHILSRTETQLTRDAIFGENVGLTFSLCFSTPAGPVYGGDFVVKTWLTKSIRIACRYPQQTGIDFTGKRAYCQQAHA